MKKKLIRTGNSAALVIEKSTMEAMGLDAQSQVLVHFDGEKLTVQPAPSQRESIESLLEVSKRTNELLEKLLAKLDG
ncbi:MAG: hypothetical protein H6624_00990 [Bdellovibrionaceae bacterium]|nr:hypothetical protein [Bdellovibrionales bacterium]MCB9082884.1 hypothetical protein [Pseudobdellovibrionaceae bacterium]